MNKELIINLDSSEVSIALLEDKKLVELHKEKSDIEFAVGDFYLGKVKKLVPSLNAAFIDVGYEKDGFLHYFDLGPQLKSFQKFVNLTLDGKIKSPSLDNFKLEKDIDKDGKIDQVLTSGHRILVQVAKEPISTKGPRLTCEMSLAGRYIVLVPLSDRISVSSKISNREEKERLKTLIKSIKPKNFGVIIRTVAEGKKVAELDADMKDLLKKWESLFTFLKDSVPPVRVLGELDKCTAILRDFLNPTFNSIYINNEKNYLELKDYIKGIAPDKENILKYYRGSIPIFEHHGIERQIKGLFGKTVTMSSGAYLIIEHTEALHVIDVNSGNTSKSKDDQETNALRVNIDAAEEIARQLRLRDMGGIIVIDFIDLHSAENRKILLNKMREFMKNDRAKHHILPPSKFGLVQITRQRVRPEMDIKTTEIIPTSNGGKEVPATILMVDEINQKIRYVIEELKIVPQIIRVHPFLEAYLKKDFWKFQRSWFLKFKSWIRIEGLDSFPIVKYEFLDKKGKKIDI